MGRLVQGAQLSADWREKYRDLLVRPDEAVKLVKSGDRVVLGHACAEPCTLVDALLERASELKDVELLHLLPVNPTRYLGEEYRKSFRHHSLFAGKHTRLAVAQRLADFTPCYFYQVPELFRDGTLPVDVAMVTVSPPDEQGRMSLGISVDYTRTAALSAKTVIAEINPDMPDTGGSSYLSVDDVDLLVEGTTPLLECPPSHPREHDLVIGRNVSALISDGDCLQFGIGGIPEAVVCSLSTKRDLGIHSELLTDSIMRLVESGVVNCRRKNFMPGKIVGTFAMGTARFYSWLHNNPMVELHQVEFVNDPFVIARNDNMVTVNSAISVDLLGQVAADMIGPVQYSGVGGQVDFVRGAARSRGGRNIIALPSTASSGRISRIVCTLDTGSAVTTSRHDVDYIVTEHGVAKLKGRTLRQRSEALISIAHPRFRDRLREQCRELYGW
jgi:4-hydroxybutyrate CoA-transferase